jgi:hypothetical protein
MRNYPAFHKLKLRLKQMTDNAGQTFIIHYKNVDGPVYDEGNQQQQDVSNQLPIDQNKPNEAAPQETPPPTHDAIKDEVQKDMINSFVSGHQCLNGVCYFIYKFSKRIMKLKESFDFFF